MANSKKRNKSYRPKPAGEQLLKTQPWKVARTFNPLYAILDQLEQDATIDVADNDQPVYRDMSTGQWFDSVAALSGTIETFEIHEKQSGIDLDMEPMRRLVNKLQYQMMIFDSDTKDCRKCVDRMKAAAMNMTATYAARMVDDFLLMEQERKAAA